MTDSNQAIITTKPYLCYFHQGPLEYIDGEPQCRGPRAMVAGGITASMAGGSWLGSLVSGFLSDMLGRKASIMIASVIWYVSYGFQRALRSRDCEWKGHKSEDAGERARTRIWY